MADRGRDLKIGILSDVSRFDLDAPARDLEDLGDKAKTGARKVDDAFDTIARASKQSARKLDTDTKDIEHSFKGVGDEAQSTSREMAASFSGSGDDIRDGFQELAANALGDLGPIGIAAGGAAALGIGLITAQQEKLKEMTQTLVEDMISAGGKLTTEAINARINTMATEDVANFTKYNEQAEHLGINITDITRARAGDVAAIGRVKARLDALDEANKKVGGSGVQAQKGPQKAMGDLRHELGITTAATEQAAAAVAQATTAAGTAAKAATDKATTAWETLKSTYGEDIIGNLKVDSSSVLRDAQIAWLEADAYFRRHPITLRTTGRTGQKPVRDVG